MENWLSGVIIEQYSETLAPVQSQVAHALGIIDSCSGDIDALALALAAVDHNASEYLYLQNIACSLKESPLTSAIDSPDGFTQAVDRLARTWEVNVHALSHMQVDPSLVNRLSRVQMWAAELKLVHKRAAQVFDSYEPVLTLIASDKQSILKAVADFHNNTIQPVINSERALLAEAENLISSIPLTCQAFEILKGSLPDLLEPWRAAWLCAELKITSEDETTQKRLALINRLLLRPSDFPLQFDSSEEDLHLALSLLLRVAPISESPIDLAHLVKRVCGVRDSFAEEVQAEQQGVALNALRRLRREVHKYLQGFARAWVAAQSFEDQLKEEISRLYGCEVPSDILKCRLISG